MARIVWSMGVGGLVLALLLALWLDRPLESPDAGPPLAELAESAPRADPPAPAAPRAPPPTAPLPREPLAVVSPPPAGEPLPMPGTAAAPWPLSPRARRKLPEQRLEIVRALRGDYATPLERRDAVLAQFQASGVSQEAWTHQARTALETWRTTLEAEVLPVRAGPTDCYAAGCVTHVTFPDAASYEEARRRVPGLKLGDVGPHMQLPPEHLPSGEVVVPWAVLSPERP
ncbi:hypothetical protein JQX13_29720 [Archangium violaceum]|uniref:hypothetical protein n=1 Tax=Archangium violaceum TaxID=83451 RepID=UPI00193C3695|nr:hypothetical protein [Archangium violaceum]QRK04428.1 hypothetical protein JQX13_29720 [Archangium violaceum]